MAISYPHTAGFLLSFNSLRIPDGRGGNDVGIRKIQLKNKMKGRSKFFGSGRRFLGYSSGVPDWSAAVTWELSHFGLWMQANAPYADKIHTFAFPYLEAGINYDVRLIACLVDDEDHGAEEGSDGPLEKTLNFYVGDVEQRVDGQLIPYRIPEGSIS